MVNSILFFRVHSIQLWLLFFVSDVIYMLFLML